MNLTYSTFKFTLLPNSVQIRVPKTLGSFGRNNIFIAVNYYAVAGSAQTHLSKIATVHCPSNCTGNYCIQKKLYISLKKSELNVN